MRTLSLSALVLAVLIGLFLVMQRVGAGAGQGDSDVLRIAAAADLQPAFTEIGELFQQEAGYGVVFIFGSSGTLAQQIENGARVDVFASANIQFVESLKAKGMVLADTQQLYAVGRIVLAVNKGTGLLLSDLKGLTQPSIRRIAIANPEHAPYGVAARQALQAAGVWEQVQPRIVYGENVRQALQYVQTGNAEAGIIALSIADVPEVEYVLIDEHLYDPIRQAMAVITGTKHEQAGRQFIAFVNGPKGRSIMKKYGFLLPGER